MSLYGIVQPIVTGFSRGAWRVRRRGLEHVPDVGACILAPSHRSMMDIPFLAAVTRRPIRFMGKQQAFDWPVVGPLFLRLGSFPVQRDGDDRAALLAALDVLADGDALAIYPEGTRQHGDRIAELQPGAAYLAIRAQAPIVPVGIAGSEEIMHAAPDRTRRVPRFGRVAIVVGEPLVPPDRGGRPVKRARVDELGATLREELQRVFDEAQRLRRA